MNEIPPEKHDPLIRDLFESDQDIVKVANQHDLSLELLAAWVGEPAIQRRLNSLRYLSQTQKRMINSRWCPTAMTRLSLMAQGQDEKQKPDDTRRACVDLLRLDAEANDENLDDDPIVPTRDSLYSPSSH